MTDNEIVKALDVCSKSTNGCSHSKYTCEDCYLNGQPMCSSVLLQDALDLINRLQADKESLIAGQETLQKTLAEKNAEIERLRKEPSAKMPSEEYPFKVKVGNNSEIHSKSIEDYDRLLFDISAEALKEFAKELKFEIVNKPSEFSAEKGEIEVVGNIYDNPELLKGGADNV